MLKKCSMCLVDKELDSSNYKQRSDREGKFVAKCIPCQAKYLKDIYNAKNRETVIRAKEKKEMLLNSLITGKRQCLNCMEIKDFKMFYASINGFNGRDSRCKICSEALKKPLSKDAIARNNLRKRINKYEITEDGFFQLFKEQESKCKICKNEVNMTTGHIDHCHKSNRVRGILCTRCNKALGSFEDNIELLQEAIKYLK